MMAALLVFMTPAMEPAEGNENVPPLLQCLALGYLQCLMKPTAVNNEDLAWRSTGRTETAPSSGHVLGLTPVLDKHGVAMGLDRLGRRESQVAV